MPESAKVIASQRVLSKLVTKSQAGSPEILLPVMNECPIYPQNLNKTEHRDGGFQKAAKRIPLDKLKFQYFLAVSLPLRLLGDSCILATSKLTSQRGCLPTLTQLAFSRPRHRLHSLQEKEMRVMSPI